MTTAERNEMVLLHARIRELENVILSLAETEVEIGALSGSMAWAIRELAETGHQGAKDFLTIYEYQVREVEA